MILLDTSVLVRHLRTPSPQIRGALASPDCAVCGVTRAEILHGARTQEHSDDLRLLLDCFRQIPIEQGLWDEHGFNLAQLRRKGLAIPFQDVLIASVAMHNDADLWSFDAHFRTIQQVLPALKLFDGPT